MARRFKTTVTTEWDIRGNVTAEDINRCLRQFLGVVMMTKENADGGYAFSGSDHVLELETVDSSVPAVATVAANVPVVYVTVQRYDSDDILLEFGDDPSEAIR